MLKHMWESWAKSGADTGFRKGGGGCPGNCFCPTGVIVLGG